MKKLSSVIAVSGFALVLASSAHADTFINQPRPLVLTHYESASRLSLVAAGADISIRNLSRLPDGRRVRLNGTIDAVHGHEFTLRDETGKIEVNLPARQNLELKKGSEVTVAGRISRGILGANIDASSVTKRNHFNQAAIVKKPFNKAQLAAAPAYTVQKLPETGLVKVSGTVITSENDRAFTLKDATGLVDISVEDEGDASNVMKGSKVTVVGTVDRGVLGKDISASTILIEKTPLLASAE